MPLLNFSSNICFICKGHSFTKISSSSCIKLEKFLPLSGSYVAPHGAIELICLHHPPFMMCGEEAGWLQLKMKPGVVSGPLHTHNPVWQDWWRLYTDSSSVVELSVHQSWFCPLAESCLCLPWQYLVWALESTELLYRFCSPLPVLHGFRSPRIPCGTD